MSRISGVMCALVLASSGMSLGCGVTTAPPLPVRAPTNFPVVVFSDLHFNPFYDPSLCKSLLAADPSQWASIFKTSKIITPSAWQSDTNYPLLVLALASIKQNLGASPLVLYTGDLIGHQLSTQLNASCGTQDQATLQVFINKTVAFVTAQVRASVGNIPVMFAVGNIDSYSSPGAGPDSNFLVNTATVSTYNFCWVL